MGHITGDGKEKNGLYNLKPGNKESRVLQSIVEEMDKTLLQHRRLGNTPAQSLGSYPFFFFWTLGIFVVFSRRRNVNPKNVNKTSG